MSQAQATVSQMQSQKPLAVFVTGRVERVERSENFAGVQTVLVCPAPDEFTPPAYVKLRSRHTVGVVGDMIKANCLVGGYRKPMAKTRGGEEFLPVDITLTVIE